METFFNEVDKLDYMGLDSDTKISHAKIATDKSVTVDFINGIKVPFWYRKSRYWTLNSSEDIEVELNLDTDNKKRFYYFMRPPVGRYLRIIDALEQMKKSSLARGNSFHKKILIALAVALVISWLFSLLPITILIAGGLGYLIYTKGLGKKIDGLTEAINAKIKHIKSMALTKPRAEHDDVSSLLHSQVQEKIYIKAKDSCAVEDTHIVGNNGKAIILQEFAFLQSPKLSGYSKLDQDYIDAYWSTETGDLVASCYYIQYIFMLEDKIETYSTFYDLIKDKQFGKDVQSFYYTDISKISEVEEDIGKFGITKFEIAINSGDKIQINLKNQNTIDEMAKKPKSSDKDKDGIKAGIQDEIKELEVELQEARAEDDIEMITNEIKELQAQMKAISFNDSMISTVESFSKSLKASVNNRKNA